MENQVKSLLASALEVKRRTAESKDVAVAVAKAAELLLACIRAGGTIYSCGNGGSSCDSMHLTEELVARYKRERAGIRAMHFHDPGTLTCWSNDYAYDDVFARQARTFCGKNDVLIGISTSGNSKNVMNAIEAAKNQGCKTIVLTGRDGGKLAPLADVALIAPAQETERIQEVHITLIHILCELIETTLLPNAK